MANHTRLYSVTWRSRQRDTFTHHVIADSEQNARAVSQAQVWIYLKPSDDLWQLESVAEAGSHSSARSGQAAQAG